MSKYQIVIHHDHDADNPCDNDGAWKFYSFSNRHKNFKEPESLNDESGKLNTEIKDKLENGLAFILSYYEHGLCAWSIAGTGPQCQWDSTRVAGLAVWEEPEENMGAKTYQEREQDCKISAEEYTDWCNGNCYYFELANQNQKIDTCGGIIGCDNLLDCIRQSLPNDATKQNTEIEDPIGVLSYSDVFVKTPACTA